MERPNLARRALMEAIGTFALVTAGCGAIITNTTHAGSIGGVGMSLVFGLVIMVMIYAGGHLSGAHYNPSVTIAFTLARHFPIRDALAYIAAQLVGATTAALLLLAAWTSKPAHLGATLPSVSSGTAVAYEIVLTAFLMFVITAVATDTRAVGAAAAIAIGGTVGLDALFGGPITGASMNPARSFGPAPGLRYLEQLLGLRHRPADRRRDRRVRLPARARPQIARSSTARSTERMAADGELPVRLPA